MPTKPKPKPKTKKPPTLPVAKPLPSLGSARVATVHETIEGLADIEMSPPHPPREDTPEYEQTHRLLIVEKDTPCKVCGVRKSTISLPGKNPAGAKDLETHHYPIERSLVDAVDWRKVHNDFPAVYSQASLVMWVDSPQNMLVLCDVHHRGMETGIHHLPTQDWVVMPYLLDGYRVAATEKDAAAALAIDEKIEQQTGIEHEVQQEIAAAPVATPKKRARKPRAARPSPSAA
jgi:hypothetical protein